MRKLTLLVSAVALGLAGAGIAAEQKMAEASHITTRAEAQAGAAKLFDRLDINHDGKLDQADRAAHMSAIFDKIDTNHDGVISREEFAAAHDRLMQHAGMGMGMGMGMGAGEGMAKGDGRGGWARKCGHMRMMGLSMAILHEADPNRTGTVTKDAFIAAALKLFDRADTNHDGKLSAQERRAAWMEGRHHMMRERGMHGMEDGSMGDGRMDMPPPPPPAK